MGLSMRERETLLVAAAAVAAAVMLYLPTWKALASYIAFVSLQVKCTAVALPGGRVAGAPSEKRRRYQTTTLAGIYAN